MRLIAVAAVLGFVTHAFPQYYPVLYDTLYDQRDDSLRSVACSNVLIARGLHTFGDLGTYPFIGGAPQIQSWDSPSCGSCWAFSFTDPNGDTTTLTFTVINVGPGAFTMSLDGMNFLTNNGAEMLDGIEVLVSQESPSLCGL